MCGFYAGNCFSSHNYHHKIFLCQECCWLYNVLLIYQDYLFAMNIRLLVMTIGMFI